MPITAKLSRAFYDRFGDAVVDELVDWLNQMDAASHASLRELNELNFARFEAKLEQRAEAIEGKIAILGTRIDRGDAALDAKIGQVATRLDAKIDHVAATLDAKLDQVATRLDAKIDHVAATLDAKIDQVATRLDAKIDHVAATLDAKIDHVAAKLDAKIDQVDVKIDHVAAMLRARIDECATKVQVEQLRTAMVEMHVGIRTEMVVQFRWMIGLWFTMCLALLGLLYRH